MQKLQLIRVCDIVTFLVHRARYKQPACYHCFHGEERAMLEAIARIHGEEALITINMHRTYLYLPPGTLPSLSPAKGSNTILAKFDNLVTVLVPIGRYKQTVCFTGPKGYERDLANMACRTYGEEALTIINTTESSLWTRITMASLLSTGPKSEKSKKSKKP